jgi:hypothetical protein
MFVRRNSHGLMGNRFGMDENGIWHEVMNDHI